MNERLLQFIWQLGYFNKENLHTADDQPIRIISPGQINHHQGPDFTAAKIRIGKTTWAGNIELHVHSSDWDLHRHSDDPNYRNVILHVVYKNDISTDQSIPVLELKDRISGILLKKYESLMYTANSIPCSNSLSSVNEIIWTGWKERLVMERLERKTAFVQEQLEKTRQHWEECFWRLLAKNFGVKVNAVAFERMAETIPVTLLAKHKHSIQQIEALLFGQAGLLEAEFSEDYPLMLQKEYRFLQKKYQLKRQFYPVHFLRMRPVNFPTIRLAQLAALIQRSSHLFSAVLETEQVKGLQQLFDVTTNDYWHYHYRFDEESGYRKKKLGEEMINTIIINTIIPLVFSYGQLHRNEAIKQKAIRWLSEMKPEQNHITASWKKLNIENSTAFDSQALIELKTQYCDQKKCLQCHIGNAILKTGN